MNANKSSKKLCKDCGRLLPETRDNFGQFKNVKADGAVTIGYRNSCRRCMAANTAKHTSENMEQKAARVQKRVISEREAGGSFSREDIAVIRKKLDNKCRFCGNPLESRPHVEHLTPVSRGGSSNLRNLTLSCVKCNLAKTNKTLEEFQTWRTERGLPNRRVKLSGECPDVPSGRAGHST